jgi:uncharacterized protein with HEPN domain
LQDILLAIGNIENAVAGRDEDAFRRDVMVHSAVIRQLEIIGEAVRLLPLETRQKRPDIPWQEIVAMRNVLAHAYFQVDLGRIWRVAKQDLPALQAAVMELLAGREP